MAVRSVQSISYSPAFKLGQKDGIGIDGEDPSDQFIKLLVSQITNQDPDKPLDSTAMITQFSQIQAALGLNTLVKSSQTYQRVQTAGTLLNKPVTVWDKEIKQQINGIVRSIDFSGPTPVLDVDGMKYDLDAVQAVGT